MSQFFYPEIPENFKESTDDLNCLLLSTYIIELFRPDLRKEAIEKINTLHQKALTEYVNESESELSDEEHD